MKRLRSRRALWTCTAFIGLSSRANARFVLSKIWSQRS